jgi:hypothetical protein
VQQGNNESKAMSVAFLDHVMGQYRCGTKQKQPGIQDEIQDECPELFIELID